MELVDIAGSNTSTFGPRTGAPEPVWGFADALPASDNIAAITTAAMLARNALFGKRCGGMSGPTLRSGPAPGCEPSTRRSTARRVSSPDDLRRRIPRPARAAARAGARARRDRVRALRPVVRSLLHRFLVPVERTADRVRAEYERRRRDLRARVRGRADACRGIVRPDRAVPRVPGARASDADPRAGRHGSRAARQNRRRSGRLPRDPGLSRAGAQLRHGR